jgi:hypothetical protein
LSNKGFQAMTVGDEGTGEERRIAEEYRRDRQKREAEQLGIPPIDQRALRGTDELLASAAISGGAKESEVPGFIKTYKDSMRDDPVGSEYDDLHAINIINRVLKQVEGICKRSGIPVRSGVAFGVTPSFGIIANQATVMATDASMLGLSIPFFVFCAAITKAMAKTLVYFKIEGQLAVDNRPEDVRQKLQSEPEIIQLWTRIFRDFGRGIWPPDLEEPGLNPSEAVIRSLLIQAVELFAIGHEYGHHSLKHGVVSLC